MKKVIGLFALVALAAMDVAVAREVRVDREYRDKTEYYETEVRAPDSVQEFEHDPDGRIMREAKLSIKDTK